MEFTSRSRAIIDHAKHTLLKEFEFLQHGSWGQVCKRLIASVSGGGSWHLWIDIMDGRRGRSIGCKVEVEKYWIPHLSLITSNFGDIGKNASALCYFAFTCTWLGTWNLRAGLGPTLTKGEAAEQ